MPTFCTQSNFYLYAKNNHFTITKLYNISDTMNDTSCLGIPNLVTSDIVRLSDIV